jgi:hypothetical protein
LGNSLAWLPLFLWPEQVASKKAAVYSGLFRVRRHPKGDGQSRLKDAWQRRDWPLSGRNVLANARPLRPHKIGREKRAAASPYVKNQRLSNTFYSASINYLMGNIITKEPMESCFPKIVGFQTTDSTRFNISSAPVKPRKHAI